MNLQNTFKTRVLVVSPFVQAAYGGALADVSLTHRPRIDLASFATLTKQFASDAEMGNKGHSFPTMRWEDQRDTGLQMALPLTEWMAGWLIGLALGKVTTNGAGPYTHLFVFDPVSGEPKITTIYCEDTAAVKYKMPDMAVSELTISGSDSGIVQAQFTLLGSGRHTDIAMADPPNPVAAPTFLRCVSAAIKFGPKGAPLAVTGQRIKNWSVRFTQGLSLHRGPGSGLYSSFTLIGAQRATASFAILADNPDDIRDAHLNDTECELQITVDEGAAAKLDIKFPSIYLSGAQIGNENGAAIWNVESDENSILKADGSELVEVTVTNSQATYLTQPA